MTTHTHTHTHTQARRPLLKRIWRRLRRLFIKPLTPEQLAEKKKQEDYEFLAAHGVETEIGYVTLLGKPMIMKAPNSRIKIGKDVLLISDSMYNAAGVNHPVILATEKEGAEIIIGDGTGFSGTSVVAYNSIHIGDRSGFGVNCNIYDSDFHSINAEERGINAKPTEAPNAPVIIGKDVWCASGVTILKGVNIGDSVVVGAMSLVNKDIPSHCMAGGVPAKIIKKI